MKLASVALAFGLWALQATALPASEPATLESRAVVTRVFLCGDSTMEDKLIKNPNLSVNGWGPYFAPLSRAKVFNHAIGGRSARTFLGEGRFHTVASQVRKGDIVVISFGHNDATASVTKNDDGRAACPGAGFNAACISSRTGEEVHTFSWYIRAGAQLMTAKGAKVLLSSQTPINQWASGTFNPKPTAFVGYQKFVADALPNVVYVDHFEAVTRMYRELGKVTVDKFYPRGNSDKIHPSAVGSEMIAKAFAQAVFEKMNGANFLYKYIKSPIEKVYNKGTTTKKTTRSEVDDDDEFLV